MLFVGFAISIVFALFGIVGAQVLFASFTGRAFWRAVVPLGIRKKFIPGDKVKMDSFMVLEEWAAFLFLGAFISLPLIALNFMGLIK